MGLLSYGIGHPESVSLIGNFSLAISESLLPLEESPCLMASLVACFGLIPCLVSSICDITFDMLFLYERSLLPLSTRVQVDRGVRGWQLVNCQRYVEFLFYQYDSRPLSERVSTLATVVIGL